MYNIIVKIALESVWRWELWVAIPIPSWNTCPYRCDPTWKWCPRPGFARDGHFLRSPLGQFYPIFWDNSSLLSQNAWFWVGFSWMREATRKRPSRDNSCNSTWKAPTGRDVPDIGTICPVFLSSPRNFHDNSILFLLKVPCRFHGFSCRFSCKAQLSAGFGLHLSILPLQGVGIRQQRAQEPPRDSEVASLRALRAPWRGTGALSSCDEQKNGQKGGGRHVTAALEPRSAQLFDACRLWDLAYLGISEMII